MEKKHKVVSQKEWLAARLALLKAEKDLTRRSDEVARSGHQRSLSQISRVLFWQRIRRKVCVDQHPFVALFHKHARRF